MLGLVALYHLAIEAEATRCPKGYPSKQHQIETVLNVFVCTSVLRGASLAVFSSLLGAQLLRNQTMISLLFQQRLRMRELRESVGRIDHPNRFEVS